MNEDRFKYFRIEAAELLEGLSQGLLAIERGGGDAKRLEEVFRLAHTLKGAARVVGLQRVAELAHDLEDRLAPLRRGEPPRAAIMEPALALLDAISNELARHFAPQSPQAEEPLTTVRVELSALDALAVALGEARIQREGLDRLGEALGALRRHAAAVARQAPHVATDELLAAIDDVHGRLEGGLDRMAVELDEAQGQVQQMRLLPARLIVSPLERSARDAAASQGKAVAFEAKGGETRLEGQVLLPLRDALMHLVRNAVAHGLEPAHERAAAGKPPQGRISLEVSRQDGHVRFVCRDDGRGIDTHRVRQAAVSRGHLSAEAAATLSEHEAQRLIFRDGLTTAELSELAGRGVGLDVVQETVRRLNGTLELESTPGRGTAITITVPLSLAAFPALVVEAGGVRGALPLEAVLGAFAVPEGAISRAGAEERVTYDGAAIPHVPLARALGRPEAPVAMAVAVRAGGARAAIGVERVLGTSDVVVRPLPAAVGELPLVSGAAFDAEGHPQPILSPEGLIRLAEDGVAGPPVAPGPLPILVIDDSLTTRMLEQSILESAGYAVDLATSGEEGLAMAAKRPYGLFIVDVEMPGMSGFDFVSRTRADARLRETPAILVTSRSAPEDRARGAEAGASAYIIKGDFDQRRFLAVVEGLIR